jgi:flagellar basal-body rod protein FlgC
MQAMEISRTGLDVEWRRLEMIAQNLANANVSSAGNAAPYQPLHLLTGPKSDFAACLDSKGGGEGVDVAQLSGVAVLGVQSEATAPHLVHEPSNPNADGNGMVAYPSIDHAAEMTKMLETARSYEANLVAMNTAREMYSKALQLGGRS